MNLAEKELEKLKKRRRLDEKISKSYGLAEHKVEKELDPALVRLIIKYFKQRESTERTS